MVEVLYEMDLFSGCLCHSIDVGNQIEDAPENQIDVEVMGSQA